HPHILTFIGVARAGPQIALVAPYMGNGNLIHHLRSHKGANKGVLIHQVGRAVSYLHNNAGIVHGDLKCANVLISDEGNALLADFGLSTFIEKALPEEITSTSIRNRNTVRFAAPELLSDDLGHTGRSKTRASDVYSFGMLILEAS
ncbi:kinase-like protein, partial [Auricularia subglabra TFB-10046 SS5]